MTFLRAGDDPSQTTWLPARVKQLMLPSFDYFRQPRDTTGKQIVSGPGNVAQGKEETGLTKVQAWVTLLTYTAAINIRKSKPLCLIIFAFA